MSQQVAAKLSEIRCLVFCQTELSYFPEINFRKSFLTIDIFLVNWLFGNVRVMVASELYTESIENFETVYGGAFRFSVNTFWTLKISKVDF